MRRAVLAATLVLPAACAHAPPPPPPIAPTVASPPPEDAGLAAPVAPPAWPEPFAAAMQGRGEPHAQPIALAPDAHGRDRWLVFAGTTELATGAWHVARDAGGQVQIEAVERWPVGVRVVGGTVVGGVAYVLLESAAVLDQPAGLRGVWVDAGGHPTPFDASPMALAGVQDVAEIATLAGRSVPPGSNERTAVALLSALRAASGSTALLARTLATEGADVGVAWQSTFLQPTAKLDGQGAAPSPVADRVLAVVRAAITTQACGADACEAWTEGGHAVVRFVVQGGRWVIRAVIEDAPVTRAPAGAGAREVAASADTSATEAVLRGRAREVTHVLGEAPLTASGGTIGVGTTDLSADVPVVAVREGTPVAARVFPVDAGTVRAEATEAQWDVAFADVDGDGRTDVVVRMSGKRADGSPVTWAQTFLAPPPSVQATSLEADLTTALATMDAPDARAAAHAATTLPSGTVSHDDACRVLSAASTVAGFRKVALPDARFLRFDEPSMPTWRPRVVTLAKLVTDDVRGLGTHCAELTCNPTRPYCAWTSGADSVHAWFGWQNGQLSILGAADYQGE